MIRRPARSTRFPYATLCRSQSGALSKVPRRLLTLTCDPPSRFITYTSESRESDRVNTILLPSGDQSGLKDRKSIRLNSSHANISHAVFCLKKHTRWDSRGLE